MALITITGFPCSGKSTRAEQIRSFLQSRIQDLQQDQPESIGLSTVSVISDDSLNIQRNAYDESKTEKVARATLFTALQSKMDRNTVVICDSLNYIKGYRYQMYCAARELSIRVATVFVAATPEICATRHSEVKAVSGSATYSDATFHNLMMRYEEPSSQVRWDSPLFTITWSDDEKSLPLELIWKAITEGEVKPPNAGTVTSPKVPTDALQMLDQTTTTIVQSIVTHQNTSGVSGGILIVAINPSVNVKIELPDRSLSLPELNRHKRQFVNTHKKAITLGSTEKGEVHFDEESIAKRFGEYLVSNIQ